MIERSNLKTGLTVWDTNANPHVVGKVGSEIVTFLDGFCAHPSTICLHWFDDELDAVHSAYCAKGALAERLWADCRKLSDRAVKLSAMRHPKIVAP